MEHKKSNVQSSPHAPTPSSPPLPPLSPSSPTLPSSSPHAQLTPLVRGQSTHNVNKHSNKLSPAIHAHSPSISHVQSSPTSHKLSPSLSKLKQTPSLSPMAAPLTSKGTPVLNSQQHAAVSPSVATLSPLQVVPADFQLPTSIIDSSYAASMLKNIDKIDEKKEESHSHGGTNNATTATTVTTATTITTTTVPSSPPPAAPVVRESTFLHVWRFIVKLKRKVANMVRIYKLKLQECTKLLLQRFPILSTVHPSLLHTLVTKCRKEVKHKGCILLNEGEIASHVYFISMGQAILLKHSTELFDASGHPEACKVSLLCEGDELCMYGSVSRTYTYILYTYMHTHMTQRDREGTNIHKTWHIL